MKTYGSIQIPAFPSTPVEGYDSKTLGWVDVKDSADIAKLSGWLAITKDNLVGKIIGTSKLADNQYVIISLQDSTVVKIPNTAVVKVAPEGTPAPKL